MRICWFNEGRLGLIDGDDVLDVSAARASLPESAYPLPEGDLLISHLDMMRAPIQAAAQDAARVPIASVRFLSPVARPTKIIGVPVNYLKHVEEAAANLDVFTDRYRGPLKEQGLFLKACSALVGPSEGVTLRFPERRSDHEMELGVVVGRKAQNVSEDDALDYVAGYALALDMVVRGPEDRSMRKSPDSYAVLGPWLVTADEIADPSNLDFELSINGEIRQKSNTRYMILNLRQQIAWASSFYTLLPGDIIMTGTCEGVSQVFPGDVLHCSIQDVGSMDVKIH